MFVFSRAPSVSEKPDVCLKCCFVCIHAGSLLFGLLTPKVICIYLFLPLLGALSSLLLFSLWKYKEKAFVYIKKETFQLRFFLKAERFSNFTVCKIRAVTWPLCLIFFWCFLYLFNDFLHVLLLLSQKHKQYMWIYPKGREPFLRYHVSCLNPEISKIPAAQLFQDFCSNRVAWSLLDCHGNRLGSVVKRNKNSIVQIICG